MIMISDQTYEELWSNFPLVVSSRKNEKKKVPKVIYHRFLYS